MNFVFLFTDQQRAESLSCYGHPLIKTPNYDRLASQGVRFEQCHTQSVLCGPSRCAVLTGLYPHVSGHRTLWNLLKPNEPNLFTYLKQAGYHIEGYGKNDVFTADTAAGCMDVFKMNKGGNSGKNPYKLTDDEYYSFLYEPFPGTVCQTADAQCIQSGIDFLKSRKRGDAPFMLYLPIVLPHPPYGPPQPYYGMYRPEDVPSLRPVNDGVDMPLFRRHMREYRRLNKLPDEFFRKINAVYLGMNSYVDWLLGNLLDTLDNSGLADDTVFILASDHGDFAGDYGLVEKIHNESYDVLTRVPLLIRAPGCSKGHAVKAQVELLDLFATIMDFAGIEASHTHFSKSLKREVFGYEGEMGRAAYCENGFNEWEKHCFEGSNRVETHLWDENFIYYPQTRQFHEHPASVCRTVTMRTDDYKLARRPADVDELYDLKNDPYETVNVYKKPEYNDIRADLNEKLLNWLIVTSDVVPFRHDSRQL